MARRTVAARRLSADEAALWARVMAQVRPMAPVRAAPSTAVAVPVPPPAAHATPVLARDRAPPPIVARPQPAPATKPANPLANTLDGSWDRQLARGLVTPDRTVDLHGHTLASAHGLLDRALDAALGDGARLLLLITGKPPRATSERPHQRGAIRAAVGDWIAGSRFSDRIAAVRGAHPRHGGAGALYIVLRKPRPARKS